jgi:glycerophosphoryl diester phosphodiesterase
MKTNILILIFLINFLTIKCDNEDDRVQVPGNINIESINYELTYNNYSVVKVVIKTYDEIENDLNFTGYLKSEDEHKEYKLHCTNTFYDIIECFSCRNVTFNLQDKYYFYYNKTDSKITFDENDILEDNKRVSLLFKPEITIDDKIYRDNKKITVETDAKMVSGGVLYITRQSKEPLQKPKDGFNKYIELKNFIPHSFYGVPQSTLSYYKEAIRRGFHIVTAQIQFTKDQIPVICHETNLETISDGEGKLESKTFEELVKLDFGSKIDKKYAGEKILTFKYLLDLCKEYNLIIDLDLSKVDSENAEKTQVYLKRLLTLIDEYCMMDSIIFNEGTNPNIITKLKEMRNEISISIPNMNKKEYIEKVKDKYAGSKRVIYDFSRISEGENIDEESVKFGVSLGHKIKASIVDNLETANKIEKWGVSYITTKVLHPFLMKNEKQDPIIVRCSPLDDHTSECEIDDDIPLKDNEYYNIYYTDNIYNISQDINLEPIGSFQFIDTNLLDELYYIVKKFDFEQGIIQLSISHELEKGEEILGAVGPSDEISTECYQYNFVCHGNGSHFVDCKIEKDDDDKVHYNGKYSTYYVEDYSLNEFEFEEHIQEDEHKEDTYIEYIVEKKTSYFFVFIIIIIIIIILAFLYFCKWRNENYYNVIRNTDNNYIPDDYLYR